MSETQQAAACTVLRSSPSQVLPLQEKYALMALAFCQWHRHAQACLISDLNDQLDAQIRVTDFIAEDLISNFGKKRKRSLDGSERSQKTFMARSLQEWLDSDRAVLPDRCMTGREEEQEEHRRFQEFYVGSPRQSRLSSRVCSGSLALDCSMVEWQVCQEPRTPSTAAPEPTADGLASEGIDDTEESSRSEDLAQLQRHMVTGGAVDLRDGEPGTHAGTLEATADALAAESEKDAGAAAPQGESLSLVNTGRERAGGCESLLSSRTDKEGRVRCETLESFLEECH